MTATVLVFGDPNVGICLSLLRLAVSLPRIEDMPTIRRNSHGRFRSRSRSRRTMSRRASSAGRVLRMTSPSQYRAMESLIRKGPMTIVLVYSPTCPHCHTYMPLWKEMCALKRKRANLVSMEASTYDQTPMSETKPVSGVPTVLFVNKEGKITEAEQPRNRSVMTEAVTNGITETEAATNTAAGPAIETVVSLSTSEPLAGTNMPNGTRIEPNPLDVLPAQPVRSESVTAGLQYGGNPWAAFLQAAAPAAILAGAYAISKARRRTVRSSGLPAPRRRRLTRRR